MASEFKKALQGYVRSGPVKTISPSTDSRTSQGHRLEVLDMYNWPWAQIWEKYWEEGIQRPERKDIFSFKQEYSSPPNGVMSKGAAQESESGSLKSRELNRCRLRDLNPRPPVYKTASAGKSQFRRSGTRLCSLFLLTFAHE